MFSTEKDKEEDEDDTCVICFEEYKDTKLKKISEVHCSGRHKFHLECI